jgi:hypothetical protein
MVKVMTKPGLLVVEQDSTGRVPMPIQPPPPEPAPAPVPGSIVFFCISTTPPAHRPFLITSTHPELAISGIVFFSGDADRGYEWCKRFAFFPPSKHNPMLALEHVKHGDGLGQWTSRIPEGEGK